MLGNDEASWVAWLTLNQIDFVLVCIAAALLYRKRDRWRIYWLGAGGWFLIQAADEYFFGNSIVEGRWEYVGVLVYAWAVYRIAKRHAAHDTGAAEPGELVGR